MALTTHIAFVLDSSGSMELIADDTRGGFNSLLKDQRAEDGEATVSLYEFNTDVERVYHAQGLDDADELDEDNYTPSGRTALYDAIVQAIDETETLCDEEDTPENVLVVVLTDGHENSSETTQETVQSRVEEKRDAGWEFMFIGANQDAALTSEEMGMAAGKALSMQHSGDGVRNAYRSTSQAVSRLRQSGATGGYTEEDQNRQA